MAHTKQAKKRIRQNVSRAAINRSRVSRLRTMIKRVEQAISAGEKEQASVELKAAQPEIMRGVSKGVLHRNTAARKVSRLAKRINAL